MSKFGLLDMDNEIISRHLLTEGIDWIEIDKHDEKFWKILGPLIDRIKWLVVKQL